MVEGNVHDIAAQLSHVEDYRGIDLATARSFLQTLGFSVEKDGAPYRVGIRTIQNWFIRQPDGTPLDYGTASTVSHRAHQQARIYVAQHYAALLEEVTVLREIARAVGKEDVAIDAGYGDCADIEMECPFICDGMALSSADKIPDPMPDGLVWLHHDGDPAPYGRVYLHAANCAAVKAARWYGQQGNREATQP